MNRRRRMLGAALLGAFLQLTASAAVAMQVVLCHAAGGHVEIESALDRDCCPVRAGGQPQHELRAAGACDGCVDVPLLRAGLSTPTRHMVTLPAPTERHGASTATDARVAVVPLGLEGLGRPPRTTVLLI